MPIPVIIKCGSCEKTLQIDEKYLGRKVRCPNCGVGIAVPTREDYINSGMAATAIARAGKKLSLRGIERAMQPLADDAEAVAGELSDLPDVMTWQDEVREILGRWQAWVPSVAVHLLVILVLGLWYVSAGEATPSILLRPTPKDKPRPEGDLGTQTLEEVDEPPGNETPMLFDLAMPGPKTDDPADDARLEDEPKYSPISVIATRARSNRAVRARTGIPSGMGPGKGKVGFFGSGGSAAVVAFIIDKSFSMASEDGRLQFSKDELKKTLNKMPSYMRFSVIYFELRKFQEYSPRPVFATADRKQSAGRFVDDITPEGGTDPYPALKRALAYNDVDLIFLLSDGVFFLSERELKEIAGICKTKKVRINTIAFKDPGGEAMLKRLAGDSGGKYKFVP